jgi:sulfate adenylyltransferase
MRAAHVYRAERGVVTRPGGPIAPHGGALVNRVLREDAASVGAERAERLPSITLTEMQLSDLEMIATGALSPLTGFMGPTDYEPVLTDMRLASGSPWSLPITLRIPFDAGLGDEVALRDATGVVRGLLEVEGVFTACTDREARAVYGTEDAAHPGVARLMEESDLLAYGNVWLVSRREPEFPDLALDPIDTRRAFVERGWRSVVGFQTRNPVHRAHEYIQKAALETVDGLLLHPLVGATKGDDVPADVRVRSYRALLDDYYPADRVVLAAFPAAMRYAGPREAVFHAIARKNYGCTHFIVGRDHAGVGNYYGSYDAQRIFERFEPNELGITPVRFEHTFYCRRCGNVASRKTCPHGAEHHVTLSGTRVRELLRAGELPPAEFTRPEVAAILADAYAAEVV